MAHLKIEFYNLALLVTSNSGTEVLLPSRKHTSSLCHPGWDAPIALTGAADVKILRNGVALSGTSQQTGPTDRAADINKIGKGKLRLKPEAELQKLLNARITLGGGSVTVLDPKLITDNNRYSDVEWDFYDKDLTTLHNDTHGQQIGHRQKLTNAFEYTVTGADVANWAVSVNGTVHPLKESGGVATLVVWTDEDRPGYHSQIQPACCLNAATVPTKAATNEQQMWNGCVHDFGYFYDLFDGTSGTEPVPFRPKDAPENPGVCIWEPICPFAWFGIFF